MLLLCHRVNYLHYLNVLTILNYHYNNHMVLLYIMVYTITSTIRACIIMNRIVEFVHSFNPTEYGSSGDCLSLADIFRLVSID